MTAEQHPAETSDVLTAALAYAGLGWHIFPVIGKDPDLRQAPHWSRDSTTDPAKIAAWYAGTSGLGIGVDMARSGLCAIDLDHPEHLPAEILADLEASGTWTHQGQRHRTTWVFRTGGQVVSQANGEDEEGQRWGEVKSAGGYIVLAPSPHPDIPETYRWLDRPGQSPKVIPADLVAKVRKRESQEAPTSPWEGEPLSQDHLDAAVALRDRQVASLALVGRDQGRNQALNRAAVILGHYVGHALDAGETEAMLLGACQENHLVEDDGLRQCKATIRSGLRKGISEPQVPDIGVLSFPGGNIEGTEIVDPASDADLTTLGLVDWSALFSGEEEEREFLVPGVIPCGLAVTLYSAPEAGKSLLALDWAAALASGGEILGEPVEPRTVLYIDHEQDRTTLRERLEAMGYESGEGLEHLHYSLHGDWPQLDTLEGGLRILAVAQALEADLVIIDTTSRVITGSENDADTFVAFYRNTVARLKGAGIASLRLDHTGKDLERGERGSSAKRGDIDLSYHLVKDGEDRVTLVREKNRTNLDGPKRLALTREQFPALRHVLAEPGEALSEKVAKILKDLDFWDLPMDEGRRKIRARYKALGMPVDTNALAKAIAVRKARGPLLD